MKEDKSGQEEWNATTFLMLLLFRIRETRNAGFELQEDRYGLDFTEARRIMPALDVISM